MIWCIPGPAVTGLKLYVEPERVTPVPFTTPPIIPFVVRATAAAFSQIGATVASVNSCDEPILIFCVFGTAAQPLPPAKL